MDFSLTDDQELMIESAREYAERYFTDEAVKQAYEVDHRTGKIFESSGMERTDE